MGSVGLVERRDLSVLRVNGDDLCVVTFARLELARSVVGRHVVTTSEHVVDVLAEGRRLRSVIACAEAEIVGRDERHPFVHLLETAKGGGEDETTDWVAVAIRSVRVQLPTVIASGDVDLCEITRADDLDVARCLDEMCARDGSVRITNASVMSEGFDGMRPASSTYPEGMTRVPRPACVHQETSIRSVSPIVPPGVGGAQRQKSSRLFRYAFWHMLSCEL